MAATGSLNNIQKISSETVWSKAFNLPMDPSLFTRINWMFGLYIGCLTAGVSYCLFNLYKVYQLRCHTSFALDDLLKVAKCRILLNEAQEKVTNNENAHPLLQKCESLLASISDKRTSFYDKEELLLRVAQYYAKNDPDHSYEIALQLSSSNGPFEIATTIRRNHPTFDPVKLNSLFSRAFEAAIRKGLQSNIGKFLEYAKAFHSVNNHDLAKRSMTEALEVTNTFKDVSVRIAALCQIAQCYQEIKDVERMNFSIALAQELLSNITGADLIQAHLVLADTFFSIEDFTQMDEQLEKVDTVLSDKDLLKANISLINTLYSFIKLIETKVVKNEKIKSIFKTLDMRWFIYKAIDVLDDPASGSTPKNRIEAYLTIASIYQEEFITD